MTAMDVRLILFDIDGTLLVTGGAGREATRLAMIEVFGTAARVDDHYFGGKTDWQTLVELLRDHDVDEARIGEAMRAYDAAVGRHIADVITRFEGGPCAGALELVEALRHRDDVVLGIVTGNVESAAPVKLRASGFDPAWFPIGAFGNEAASRDDLPALALARAIEHVGVTIDGDRVIVVGDTPADIACARAVGALAVAVATGFASRDDLAEAGPDHLLDDLTAFESEVLGVLPRP
jgi:phosphoglycolate phosphatase-like HAD superfamily hydrolase